MGSTTSARKASQVWGRAARSVGARSHLVISVFLLSPSPGQRTRIANKTTAFCIAFRLQLGEKFFFFWWSRPMPAVLTSRWGLGSVTVVVNDGGGVPTSSNEGTCSSSISSRSSGGGGVNRSQNRKTLTAPAAHSATTAAAAAAAAAAVETAPTTATGTTTTTTTTTTTATLAPQMAAPSSPPLLSSRPSCSDDDDSHEEEEDGDDEEEPTGKTLWDCAKVLYDLVANPDPNNVFSVRGKVRYRLPWHSARRGASSSP